MRDAICFFLVPVYWVGEGELKDALLLIGGCEIYAVEEKTVMARIWKVMDMRLWRLHRGMVV